PLRREIAALMAFARVFQRTASGLLVVRASERASVRAVPATSPPPVRTSAVPVPVKRANARRQPAPKTGKAAAAAESASRPGAGQLTSWFSPGGPLETKGGGRRADRSRKAGAPAKAAHKRRPAKTPPEPPPRPPAPPTGDATGGSDEV